MMKHFCTMAAALAAFLPTPAGAQKWDPYSPWSGTAEQQQIRREIDELRQEIYNLKDQRMKDCVNSRSTYCGWDKGSW